MAAPTQAHAAQNHRPRSARTHARVSAFPSASLLCGLGATGSYRFQMRWPFATVGWGSLLRATSRPRVTDTVRMRRVGPRHAWRRSSSL